MKVLFSLPAMLAAGYGLLAATQPWTVDAILNIPTLSDPQVRPDGQAYAYVRRVLDGAAWRSSVYVNSIPWGKAWAILAGNRPRWSPDSKGLAYLDQQVSVFVLASGASRSRTRPRANGTARWWPCSSARMGPL